MKKKVMVLALAATMSVAMVGCGSKAEKYEGIGKGHNGDVKVSVGIEDGKITSIDVLEHEETEGIGGAAIEELTKEMVEKNSTDVEAVAGATVTSDALKEAVDNAVEASKK